MEHLNNAVYLQWVQEAVVHFWQHSSPIDTRAQFLWVALKHEITYRISLFLDDRVNALVTATATRGSRASFSTLFTRGHDWQPKYAVLVLFRCSDPAAAPHY